MLDEKNVTLHLLEEAPRTLAQGAGHKAQGKAINYLMPCALYLEALTNTLIPIRAIDV